MPRIAMDYAKVVIYHFVCQDPTQVARYVGSTTNFIKRKALHKCICNKEDHKDYNRQLYQTIRDNGGWDNWEMKPLEEYPCQNHIQQQIREQYWMDKLLPTMNMNKAYIEDKVAYKTEYNAKWVKDHPTYHKEWRARRKDEMTLPPDLPSVLS